MKFSTVLGLASAPLCVARQVRSAGPGLSERSDSQDGKMSGSGMDGTKTDPAKDVVVMSSDGLYGDSAMKTSKEAASKAMDASQTTHTVVVGGDAGLVYTPDSITAKVGDMVVFQFMKQNHTVTQSAFDKPCVRLPGGMDSGFMANPNNTIVPAPMYLMKVMVSTPLWFYCKQKTGNHCGKGMVFSINPTTDKTQAKFQQMAIQQNGTGDATPITNAGSMNNPAAAPAPAGAPAPAAANPPGSYATGTGTIGSDGSCQCVAYCGAGSFPSANQGMGAMGGMGGSVPANMGSMAGAPAPMASAPAQMESAPAPMESAYASAPAPAYAPAPASAPAPAAAPVSNAVAPADSSTDKAAQAPQTSGGEASGTAEDNSSDQPGAADVSDSNPLGGNEG